MESSKVLFNRRGAPRGTRTLRCCLAALLLLFAVQGAWAGTQQPRIEGFSKSVSIDGKLHYSFSVLFFRDTRKNYFWRGDNVGGTGKTVLKIDGKTICSFKELLDGYYTVGSNSDSEADNFVQKYDGLVVTRKYNISNMTDVYISAINPCYGSGDKDNYWVTIDIAFERNFVGKQWDIGWSGYWNYDNGSGTQVNMTLFTTDKPTVTMPTITSSNFSRSSNKKIKLNYPSATGYSGWSTQTIMYKSDCTNKWMNPSSDAFATLTSTGEFDVSDNYTPVTIYPRFEYYKNANPASAGNGSYTLRFDKDYGAITIPGQPRPKNIQVSGSNSYSKRVTISWERDAYDSNTATNGKWIIYRKITGNSSSQVKLGETANGTYSYTDTSGDLAYGTTYTYTVCYQPNGWTISSEGDAEGLNGYVRYKLERDFAFSNLSTSVADGKITFSWSHSAIQDASTANTYKLYVQRSDDGGTTWTDLRTDNITSSSTTSGSYSDANVKTHKPYMYRLKINVQDQDTYSTVETATVTTGSNLTGFTASRGAYSTSVKLAWTVNQIGTDPTYFTLQRRPLGSTNESLWAEIYTTSGTASNYSYDDNTAQPGSFNEYRLKIFDIYNGTRYEGTAKKTDGFCLSTGVVSGRITYGSGTAVEGAKVTLKSTNADGNVVKSNRSIKFDASAGEGMKCSLSQDELTSIFGGDFTVQMWVNPDTLNNMNSGANKILFDVVNTFSIYLMKSGDGTFLIKNYIDGNNRWNKNNIIPGGQWTHLSFVYSNGVLKIMARQSEPQWLRNYTMTGHPVNTANLSNADGFVLGNSGYMNFGERFSGYVDELRIFNRALTDDEIVKNFNHTLNGSEEGLQAYYTFDEGIENQTIAYDFSKQNGLSNGHHALANVAAKSEQNVVPSDNQLSLMTYTDQDGNYMLRGIPFQGEGTSYTITPTLGIHKFKPGSESRFFNLNSLSYSAVDFEDVSSFPVTGVVYFDGTTIPVEDALIYIDGNLASKDGEAVRTNAKGEYQVDVPIGDHFIQVKKNGHTFVDDGRYPPDPDGLGKRFTFEEAKSNLSFYDNTRVTVAGRVAGGDIEHAKPLGLRQGVANIGKAKLTLTYANSDKSYINATETKVGTTVSWSNNTTSQRDFDPSTPNVNSTAYVEKGANKVTIETDPVTGEWAAELLPLRYTVESVQIPSNKGITFSSLPDIDATNPTILYTDTVAGGIEEFSYAASSKIMYKTKSTIDVTEHEGGAYGEKSIKVKGLDDSENDVQLYTVGNNGAVNYTFGYPVYQEMGNYTYQLHAFERYENRDASPAVVDLVPLANKTVKIENQYATGVSVSLEDGTIVEGNEKEFELDSLGCLTYTFTAGLPNIQPPYTRGISIAFDDNGTMVPWDGNETFKAIVLGAISTGNNFTTQAPDQVLMVLRDPPGSASSITYSKGTTHTEEGTLNVQVETGAKIVNGARVAVQVKTVNGVGVAVVKEISTSTESGLEMEANVTIGTNNSWSHSVTLTQDISTSTEPDFVGAPGDLFIGVSKNTIFGTCHVVKVVKNETTGLYELAMENGYSVGDEFGTMFNYSQNYIENVLMPNFVTLRNGLLHTVADLGSVAHPVAGEDPIYVTTLATDDEKFGSDNADVSVWGTDAKKMSTGPDADGVFRGPSYWIVLPADWKTTDKAYQDMVQFYNEQVRGWQRQLSRNEEAKVLAIQNRDEYLIDNYSLDAGGTLTRTTEVTDVDSHSFEFTEQTQLLLFTKGSSEVDGTGVDLSYEFKTNEIATTTYVNTDEKTTGFSFTLAESGDDDYLSVDVFNAPDNYGPIFYTRGGATCCPYEDEVKTRYYEPGTVISEKTVQIEKPEIEARTQLITGIPAGGTGTFQVYIRNNSDTQEDIWYNLNVTDASNPDGLVVKMDGVNINKGRTILVPAGETMTKTFTVEQSNPDVMNYENIQLRISSICQPDNTGVFPEIADTTTISVYFQPSCSDVQLAASHSLVNTDTETAQTFSISGYNYSMQSLQGIRLQYKGLNDANFTTLQEYSKDEARVEADQNLKLLPALEGTSKLNYVIDLRSDDFTDQTYVFRAITVCMQGGVEVNNESEEIVVVRDMTRPMLMATPSPASGILTSGDDLLITFNEDIKGGILSKPNNFDVFGVLNESRVAHDVALSLTGENAAKTDAPINLAGKSFSASMWVNYSTDGTLLMHGTKDNNFTATIEGGKLAVSVAGTKVTSTAAMPVGKWLYLNISYDAEARTVSADYAQDASEVALITSAEVPAYEGNGIISVGGNSLTAKVQELSLWNSARTMAEAQAGMYTTKNKSTRGLIGYWQMDEGHGNTATDRARSRHITLPGMNAWWINGDNYALTLDGTKAAAANIGAVNTTASEDYLIEAWLKADETQNGVASILSTQVMDLRLNAQGRMELALNGSAVEVMNTDLRDGQWHHVAVNVLKSNNGSGTVYVDGEQRRAVAATAMPALYGDKLMLGSHRTSVDGSSLYTYDQMLRGAIDEVRIWKGRRTADVIKSMMYQRVKADETGLVGYYPMESFGLDAYNQTVSTATMADATERQAGELAFFTAGADATTGTTTSTNTAALKRAPEMENVQFSFVASERQIKVDLEEQPYKIEGCNIYITAKNVRDANGNAAQPITWSVYVQQNNLKWEEPDVALAKTVGEAGTFTATITNRGSESEAWSLSGLPAWLTANTEGGVLKPQMSETLTFTVAESVAIGKYEQAVYLTGNNSIAEPMTLTLKVTGRVPNWAVNPKDFENSMNIIGRVEIDGKLMDDEDDIVAAFIGEECRGVAHPVYKERYDGSFITMDIYGGEENGQAVTFRAYDASTGTLYPVVTPSQTVTFSPLALIGKYNDPVVLTVEDLIEQQTELKAGWNWLSLYVQPEDMTVPAIFANIADDVVNVKSQNDGYLTNENNSWGGSLTGAMSNTQMYAVQMKADRQLRIVGQRVDPASAIISAGEGWNWIGYYGRQVASVSEALAGFGPENGDILKGQSGVSYYDDYEWAGSLPMMEPGIGYMLKSTTSRQFSYPAATVAAARALEGITFGDETAEANASLLTPHASSFSPVSFRKYANNAIMAVRIVAGGRAVANTELGVFAGDECRMAAVTNGEGVAYLTIPGDDAVTLTFKVAVGNQMIDATTTVDYEVDGVYGSPQHPIVVNLGAVTGIREMVADGQDAPVYDLQGRKISLKDGSKKLNKGVYIVNGQKRTVK